jgi:deoxycytidine triphosphate deaminase
MWSDVGIKRHLADGDINIDPWDEKSLQPASVDLRLGNAFRRQQLPNFYRSDKDLDEILSRPEPNEVLDPALNAKIFFTNVFYEQSEIIIRPQEFILGVTQRSHLTW